MACRFGVLPLAVGLGVWVLFDDSARAQGLLSQTLLPAEGADVRVGDLRDQFKNAFPNLPVAQAHSWNYTAGLDISETYDDGLFLNNGRTGADLVTQVTPSISITGDSSRLTGTLFYGPSINIYAQNGNQNGITQNLNAQATLTVVQDLLFVDLRGYAATQSVRGGYFVPGNTAEIGRNDQAQTMSFSINPYLKHRFGGTGTAQIGYSLSRSIVDTSNVNQANLPFAVPNQNTLTQEENASFTTGEDFGRINSTLSAVATQYSGGGVLQGAHREIYNYQAGYAWNRWLTLTASIGHENIIYPNGGLPPIDDVTWSGGITLTPNADTTISISYGHQEGATNISFDSSMAVTQRTRVYARYSTGVGSQLENLQNALAGTTVGPGGVAINPLTNAPLQLNNNFLGYQSAVFRTVRASIGGVLLLDRDTVTLDLEHDDQTQLSSAAAGGGSFSNSGATGSLTWTHDLSEATTTTAYLQYGTRNLTAVAGPNSQQTVSVSASINYLISATLSASAQITRSQTSGNTFGLPPVHDLAVVSLHKTF